MSAIRRFFNSDDDNSVFKFVVDTTLGANAGNTFTIPFTTSGINSASARFILRVSDGRPDVSVVGNVQTLANRVITFATPGIYTITIIGIGYLIGFPSDTIDTAKIIYVDHWPLQTVFNWSFQNCLNLIVRATNTLNLPESSNNFFLKIKGFESADSLRAINTEKVTTAQNILRAVQNPLLATISPFWKNSTLLYLPYYASTFDSSVDKFEIISDTIVTVQQPFSNFRGRVIFKTPNLKTIISLINYANPPSLGEIDIRSLTTVTNYIFNSVMSTSNVDATLLGWVNNFDWSDIAPVANKVTIDFYNSKYSNNPSVIAAKAFLEAKGYVFTRLTMA